MPGHDPHRRLGAKFGTRKTVTQLVLSTIASSLVPLAYVADCANLRAILTDHGTNAARMLNIRLDPLLRRNWAHCAACGRLVCQLHDDLATVLYADVLYAGDANRVR